MGVIKIGHAWISGCIQCQGTVNTNIRSLGEHRNGPNSTIEGSKIQITFTSIIKGYAGFVECIQGKRSIQTEVSRSGDSLDLPVGTRPAGISQVGFICVKITDARLEIAGHCEGSVLTNMGIRIDSLRWDPVG